MVCVLRVWSGMVCVYKNPEEIHPTPEILMPLIKSGTLWMLNQRSSTKCKGSSKVPALPGPQAGSRLQGRAKKGLILQVFPATYPGDQHPADTPCPCVTVSWKMRPILRTVSGIKPRSSHIICELGRIKGQGCGSVVKAPIFCV